jgi:organic hydroperoxide reductase OsmC/OhrA
MVDDLPVVSIRREYVVVMGQRVAIGFAAADHQCRAPDALPPHAEECRTMQAYPHVYQVTATAGAEGQVQLAAAGVDTLAIAPPVEFDGPGDLWSPETLLTAAVADCFILTFRAVARGARFTRFTTHARLSVAAGSDEAKAHPLLEKAEHACLVANSLVGSRTLVVELVSPS